MEQEYKTCFEHWMTGVSTMTRIQMMRTLGVGSEEMNEIITEGSFRGACQSRFDRIWNEMGPNEQLDYYAYITEGDTDEE